MVKSKEPNSPECTLPAKISSLHAHTHPKHTHTWAYAHTSKSLASRIKDFMVDPCISNVFYFLYSDALIF